jgi:hypothetical protein
MIEQTLIQYGVLGLWTITLLIDKIKFQKEMRDVIRNNTEAFIRYTEVIRKCSR